MATIKSLVVTLSANSAKLTKELGKTRKAVKSWAKGIAGTVAKIGGAFTGLAAIAGGALLVAINRNAAAIDDMTKAASKLQFPIEDYQKFAFIAEKSNISIDVFGKSMQRMLKTVGDAKAGLSTASDALDQLGLTAGDLERLNPSQQFQLIAERMKGIVSQSDKVKIAMDIFGRSGADLLNVFAGDVKKIGDEFDGLGVVITQRQADMVAAFQDSKTTLSTLFAGFGRNLTAEISPALTIIVERITNLIKKMGGMKVIANKFAKAMISGIIGAVKGFAALIEGARKFSVELIDLQAKWLAFKSVVTFDNIFNKDEVNKQFDDLFDKRFKLQLELQSKDTVGQKITAELETILQNVGNETVNASSSASDLVKKNDILGSQALKTAQALKAVEVSSKTKAKVAVNPQISKQFLQFIDQAKRDINSGSSFTEGNFTALNNLIAASKNNAALPETTRAMQEMVDSLRQVQTSTQASADAVKQQTQENRKSIGELTINMITDTGKIAGKIFGEPEFLDRLKTFVGNQTNDTARAVIN